MRPESWNSIRCIPYFMSHWLLFCIAAAVSVICISTARSRDAGPFKSAEVEAPFSLDPTYIVQLTDTHFTVAYLEKMEKQAELMKNIRNILDPRITVITGDITDGTNTTDYFATRQQYQEAWDLYNDTIHASGLINANSQIIEVPGNHDSFNIESYDSPANYMRSYFSHPNANETINTYDYTIGDYDLHFVTFNPVRFPYLSAPIGTMPYCAQDILDDLESSFRPGSVNILLSHYTRGDLWSGRSSSGLTLDEILNKADIFLNGHVHPETAVVEHVDELLSVTCPSTGNSREIGLISIERSGLVYHRIDPWQEDIIAVTYPVPLEQASTGHVFDCKSFPVRVLSFTEDPLDLEVVIDGESIGKLDNPRKLADARSTWFYTLEVHNLDEGVHTLGIKGTEFEDYEFYVGSETPVVTHRGTLFGPRFFFIMLPVMWFLCILRVIPWWIPMERALNEYEDYMHRVTDTEIKWYKQLYLGPLHHYSKLRKTPMHLYIIFVVATMWFFVVPFYIAKSESTVAAVWSWGYIAAGEVYHFNITLCFSFLYYFTIFIPLANVCGNFYESKALSGYQIIEIIMNSLCLSFMWITLVVILRLAGEVFTVFTSPAFYSLTFFIGITFWTSIRDLLARQRDEKAGDINIEDEQGYDQMCTSL